LNGSLAGDILNEEDMVSDAVEALATQHSIKSFVGDSIEQSPGIFEQSLFTSRSTSNYGLHGGMASYLELDITVETGSYVHIHAFASASGMYNPGAVYGSLWRDSILLTTEEYPVAENRSANDFEGSTTRVHVDGPLQGGTYTYIIKLREQITDGLAKEASLLLLETKSTGVSVQ